MPGSTPISVPSRQPMKAYRRLTGVSATPKPMARWLNNSMSNPSAHESRPNRQLELQADHENAHRERGEQHADDKGLTRAKLGTRGARADDQDDGRERNAGPLHDGAEQHDAAEHDDRRPPFPPRQRRPIKTERAKREDRAQADQQDAQNAREVTRPHASRGSERVLHAIDNGEHTDRDEEHAGPEILRMAADRHTFLLL